MTKSIDWPRLLGDIAYLLGDQEPGNPSTRTPLGTRLLATQLGIPRSTVVGWIDGSEPKHTDGEALLDRWCSLTGKSRMFAPLQRRPLSASRQDR